MARLQELKVLRMLELGSPRVQINERKNKVTVEKGDSLKLPVEKLGTQAHSPSSDNIGVLD